MNTFFSKARQLVLAAVAGVALAQAGPASAIIVLDFEGIGDQNPVGDYYNGNGGPNYGIVFSGPTLALVDADNGGNGNFANEPSPNTIMFFLDANNAILNVAAGFDTGFSFWYTSSTDADVTVYDGLDGTGNVLGTIHLTAQYTGNNCTGDPTGTFCNWTPIGVAFAGTAKSINFGGTANQTGYDNITFGSATPAPEPATLALLGLGLLGLGAARLRKRG